VGGLRHVWVRRPFTPTELPGLVLDWRQHPDGWFALVTYVETRGRVLTEWVPADQLRPLAARPGTGSAYG
jgi:hypothetical protein